ncbi:hypothetical protein V8C42DRAFT_348269 [Trichoderma barbatum]
MDVEVEVEVVQDEASHLKAESTRKSKNSNKNSNLHKSQRLNELDVMITGSRRLFVQDIWFRFERSIQPGVMPIKFRCAMDSLRFDAANSHLFQILSEWPSRASGQPGVALELTAFSAMDLDHSMKEIVLDELKDVDLTVDSEALDAIYEKTPSVRRTLADHERIQQYELRTFYDTQSNWTFTREPLPIIRLITDPTLRRQMHISFFTKSIMHMMDSLPYLEFLTYEPCTIYPLTIPVLDTYEAVKDIITTMPSIIRRLQVFEDIGLYDNVFQGMRLRGSDSSLDRVLAEVNQDKEPEVISMSFIVDAIDFFSDF